MAHPHRTLRAPVVTPPAELSALREFMKSPALADSPPALAANSAVPVAEPAPAARAEVVPVQALVRVNFNTRLAPDVDAALKRATLERKLNRQTPHTIQEIVDEALRPWLLKNGYLNR